MTKVKYDLFQTLHGEWIDKTFPNVTLDSIASHFREEAIEFAGGVKITRRDPEIPGFPDAIREVEVREISPSHDPEEAADCFLLLLSHAHKAGYSLFDEALKKSKINKERDWDSTDESGAGHFKHKKED